MSPTRQLLFLIIVSTLAAFAGVRAAHWQVPPDSLEEPPPILSGSTVPLPAGTIFSDDPAALRDYHFTLAANGDAQAYLAENRVQSLISRDGADLIPVKLIRFDADLALVTLPDSPELSRWILAKNLIDAHESQKERSPLNTP